MVSLGIQVLLVLAVTYGGVKADIGCLSFGANTSVNAEPGCLMPRDCKEWFDLGIRKDGVYPVNPGNDVGFQVYCDMTTDGGGWTVFQRRVDGLINFYRNWANYEVGFGFLDGEFWLGLEKIHRLTRHSRTHTLRVEVTATSDGSDKFAKYSSFHVMDGTTANLYKLEVGGYTGTAGDWLTYNNGRNFTTFDRNNDGDSSTNCAKNNNGAWWYNFCSYSELNAGYDSGNMRWKNIVKKSEMKVKEN